MKRKGQYKEREVSKRRKIGDNHYTSPFDDDDNEPETSEVFCEEPSLETGSADYEDLSENNEEQYDDEQDGEESEEEDPFCNICGDELEEDSRVCPNCAKVLVPKTSFACDMTNFDDLPQHMNMAPEVWRIIFTFGDHKSYITPKPKYDAPQWIWHLVLVCKAFYALVSTQYTFPRRVHVYWASKLNIKMTEVAMTHPNWRGGFLYLEPTDEAAVINCSMNTYESEVSQERLDFVLHLLEKGYKFSPKMLGKTEGHPVWGPIIQKYLAKGQMVPISYIQEREEQMRAMWKK
uniref:Zn-ribbon domain protein n=1 Tax=Clandestinovirus TaxID=2831644 RepID=A0A8F8KPE1_9VIRU|nr:Zn-ribbon domain protein [Clandestinovirus]